MTRAPRSRKKKPIVTDVGQEPNSVGDKVPEPAGATLPLLPSELSAASAAEFVAVAPGEVATALAEPAPLVAADAAPEPAALSASAALDTRSSMRVEFTDERPQLGSRLRAAREARAWSREDVAHRLHVPTSVVADIEAERFERLGAPIYLRGYLSKYATLVELPQIVVSRALEGLCEPVLKASTDAPPAAPTWERYRGAVIGGVITLAVAIPMLTMVANRGIHAPVPQVRSLDESEMLEPVMPATASPANPPAVPPSTVSATTSGPTTVASDPIATATAEPVPGAGSAGVGETEAADEAPESQALMASMTGFSTPATPGTHVLEAYFREDSWIEIFAVDGRAIEQNLVRAGQTRRYESTGAVSVKVGNVSGVDLRADGNPIDLAVHARANVARLRLFEPASVPTP
ncbi:MAG: DUF4115 domain-containing protein [Xanthomonadales bacterium]|nr:DUF4115 domain-containing protein [Xanthomonadales bacterium]